MTEVVGKAAGRKGSLLSHLHDLQLRGRAPSMAGADDVPRHRLCGKERAARLQPSDKHPPATDGRPPHPDAPATVGRVCAGDPGAAAARVHGDRWAARAQGARCVHQVGADWRTCADQLAKWGARTPRANSKKGKGARQGMCPARARNHNEEVFP